MPRPVAALAALLLLAACTGSSSTVVHSPSPFTGGLTPGLIGDVADQGLGVLDPATGKSANVAPRPPGAFRGARPLSPPPPGPHPPGLYFTVHHHRPAANRTAPGV